MTGTDLVRPPVSYDWLAVAFLFLGIGVFGYTMIHAIFHITDSLTPVVVPGSADLALKTRLSYKVFLEEESVANGRIYAARESVSGLTCKKARKGARQLGFRKRKEAVGSCRHRSGRKDYKNGFYGIG